MLEERTYTYAELSSMFGTRDNQGIQRRLDTYGIEYETAGWGGGRTYTIQKITDPFKVFCILDLGFDSRTDFCKLRDFLFVYLNDDDFNWKPYEMMEGGMRAEGMSISRQTISGYVQRLEQNNLFKPNGDTVYYKVYKIDGNQIHEIIPKEEYSAAWSVYWDMLQKGYDSRAAYSVMYGKLGGVPRKFPRRGANAFYLDKLDKLSELVTNSLLAEDGV